MLTNNLRFIHSFDEKLHYLNFYYQLDLDDNEISFNDSVNQKKCSQRHGRWNFIKCDSDYSCGVYNSLEVIRQSILLAKENNKHSVDIALASVNEDPDMCFAFHYDREDEKFINMENLKKCKTFTQNLIKECYGCDTIVSKKIIFKIIKPVLEHLFKEIGYQLSKLRLKGRIVRGGFGSLWGDFKRDLDIIRIEFGVSKIFNESIKNSPILVNKNKYQFNTA